MSFHFNVTWLVCVCVCVCVSGLSLPREHRSPFIVYTGVFQNCHSYSDKSSIRYHTIVGEMDSSPLPYCHLRLEVMPLMQISQNCLEKKNTSIFGFSSFLTFCQQLVTPNHPHFWPIHSNRTGSTHTCVKVQSMTSFSFSSYPLGKFLRIEILLIVGIIKGFSWMVFPRTTQLSIQCL